jgi:hypothetical protein
MPCQTRLEVPGTLHHVTLRGIKKRWIVSDAANRKHFVKCLGELPAIRRSASMPVR